MTYIKFTVLAVLVAAVAAEPPVYPPSQDVSSSYGVPHNDFGGYGTPSLEGDGYGAHDDHHESKPYEFGYAVKDEHYGTDFGQHETSDGNNVKGTYRVVLPDGRTQIVTYHADWKTGFHADIKYEGEAHYPEPKHQEPGSGGYSYPAPAQTSYSSSGELGGQGYNHVGYKR